MTIDDETATIIDALVPQVPFDGWTLTALRNALTSLNQNPDDAPLIFPNGVTEMLESYTALADQRMIEAAKAADVTTMRIPDRIQTIIELRLSLFEGQQDAIRRALALLTLPTNAPLAAKTLARTVDAIWHAAGDTSADFAWYTKRATLAAIYPPILLFWLNDTTNSTPAFIARRLAGVARLGSLSRIVRRRKVSK
jgi:ubiquinone biosynthesis protein COQ9